jgi:hypothetical protein
MRQVFIAFASIGRAASLLRRAKAASHAPIQKGLLVGKGVYTRSVGCACACFLRIQLCHRQLASHTAMRRRQHHSGSCTACTSARCASAQMG